MHRHVRETRPTWPVSFDRGRRTVNVSNSGELSRQRAATNSANRKSPRPGVASSRAVAEIYRARRNSITRMCVADRIVRGNGLSTSAIFLSPNPQMETENTALNGKSLNNTMHYFFSSLYIFNVILYYIVSKIYVKGNKTQLNISASEYNR